MKIIATGKDGVRPYRMMDDCPRCDEPVAAFQCDYGTLPPPIGVYDAAEPVPFYVYHSGPTLTLQPCGCSLPLDGSKWNVYQFASKADWNKEVVTHELRNKSKEDRKGS